MLQNSLLVYFIGKNKALKERLDPILYGAVDVIIHEIYS